MLDLIAQTSTLIDVKGGQTYNRDDIVQSVIERVDLLCQSGATKSDRIVIAHRDSCGVLADLFSCWQIGATVILVPSNLTPDERNNVVTATNAKFWIGDQAPDTIVQIECLPMAKARGACAAVAPLMSLDDPALVLMTSGTTSAPKGVVHSLRTLIARLALNKANIDNNDLSRCLNVLPMHFGHGLIGNSLTPLYVGSTLALWPEPGIEGLSRLGSLLDELEITFLSSVPAFWRVAMRVSPKPTRGLLRRVHIGSAPLSALLWEEVAGWTGIRRIVNTYGITETANWIGGHSLEDGPAQDGLVGLPWGGRIAVLDNSGEIRSTGQGSVLVTTPSAMLGYLERADLTDAAFMGPWFSTGDTGNISVDGRLRIVGRRQNEINRGGLKVSAEEIDLLVERHPAILEACAFPVEDPIAGEIIGVAVVTQPQAFISPVSLIAWCSQHIRPEAVPSRIYFLPELPKTERGKINRDTVKAKALLMVSSDD